MKNTKKLLISVITVALSLMIVIGCTFTTLAADIKFNEQALTAYKAQGYGSADKGISVEGLSMAYKYFPSIQYGMPNINSHPNLDFEKGWEFWMDTVNYEIRTEKLEDGKTNNYGTVVGEENYKGIYSVRFNDSRIKAGDSIAVLYKWRNAVHQRDIEPKLIQLLYEKENDESTFSVEHQLVHGSGDGRNEHVIWVSDEEDDKEWNITLSRVLNPIKEASGEYQPVYSFFICMQTRNNVDFYKNTDFDDMQMVRYDEATGLIYDLDGKQLYNLNALPTREMPDYIWGDLEDKDPNAKIKVNVDDIISGKIDISVDGNLNNDGNSSGIALWVWIVIAAGAVLILAAVVVIIVAKKKKAALAPAEETEAEAEETTEENTEE